MWQEFKDFAMKGNVIDLAVGVMIGTAFNKIVTSLVNDLIMPFFALLIGEQSFTELEVVGIRYGSFLQSIIDFLLIGLSLFFVIKFITRLRKRREKVEEKKEEAPKITKEEELLTEIRDLLKEQSIKINIK